MPTSTYMFDAYGTLFDVHAAIARHRAAVGADADRLSELLRSKQLEYTWTLTLAGRYEKFSTLTERALDYALARFPAVDRALKPKLMEAYFKLDAYPDARETLRGLKARGHTTAILSNGSPDMLAPAVEAAGLAAELDAVISIDEIRMYKPRPEVYQMAIDRLAVKPADVTFVSSNRWDVMGAAAFGLRAAWINRAKMPDEYANFAPAAMLTDLGALLALA